MSELLNREASVQGKIPSGYLNTIFELSGDWLQDVAGTKYLSFDGYFISLYCLQLTSSPLILQEKVKNSVPPCWDPASLARLFFLCPTLWLSSGDVYTHMYKCIYIFFNVGKVKQQI